MTRVSRVNKYPVTLQAAVLIVVALHCAGAVAGEAGPLLESLGKLSERHSVKASKAADSAAVAAKVGMAGTIKIGEENELRIGYPGKPDVVVRTASDLAVVNSAGAVLITPNLIRQAAPKLFEVLGSQSHLNVGNAYGEKGELVVQTVDGSPTLLVKTANGLTKSPLSWAAHDQKVHNGASDGFLFVVVLVVMVILLIGDWLVRRKRPFLRNSPSL